MKKAVRRYARDEFDARLWNELAEDALRRHRLRRRRPDWVADALRELDELLRLRRQPLYYLAVPPDAFETIVNELGERRSTDGWIRLIVEKPFASTAPRRIG